MKPISNQRLVLHLRGRDHAHLPTSTLQSPQAHGDDGGGIQTEYTITRRKVYFLAGQAIAVRQVVEGGTSNLLHLHSDDLGSNSVMSYNNEGGMVGGSRARYLPLRQACIE